MKKWLIILCVAMGLLLLIGIIFIAAGLSQEQATGEQQYQAWMEEIQTVQAGVVSYPLQLPFVGEAAHV